MFRDVAGEDGYLHMDQAKALTATLAIKQPAVAKEIKKLYDACTENGRWGMA